MGEVEALINALHQSVVERMDPQFTEIYNKYQGTQNSPTRLPQIEF